VGGVFCPSAMHRVVLKDENSKAIRHRVVALPIIVGRPPPFSQFARVLSAVSREHMVHDVYVDSER